MSDTVTYGRSRSAGTSTTSGASAPEYKIEYRGYYQVNQRHELESPLKKSIEALEAAAARFATDAISDGNVRVSYQKNIQRMSQAVLDEVDAGTITAKEGMQFASKMRNKIMMEHRVITSRQGLAIAEAHKKVGLTEKELLDIYSKRLYGKDFERLTRSKKTSVYYAIVKSAASSSTKFDVKAKKLKVMGRVGWVVTATLATYSVAAAENKKKEAIRQGVIISGGMLGGTAAGLAVSTLCGPGAPFCAIAVILAGSVAGGVLSEVVVDSLDDELEEFANWQLQ
ncbi:hypothetical protein [Chromobacterium sp. Panama]|uniref:hypothetical protein n=1 Tax=Chromobacterium sp. Panama TaxID=2161826 RepID=UPI0018EE5A0F|nr:hypothetical protein [Chromobacterium sp. Panama]